MNDIPISATSLIHYRLLLIIIIFIYLNHIYILLILLSRQYTRLLYIDNVNRYNIDINIL